ncbi:MAG: hypothetical protein KGK07_07500 [Chloroflexota bacterium]|nr:hypothetical protein [Chloroflexota bacterium]
MAGMTTSAGVTLLMQHPLSPEEEDAFQRFCARSVDLTAEDTKRGREIRDAVIRLIEAQIGPRGLLIIRDEGFGAGSFGRKTQCQPLDDVDIYIVLNSGTVVMKQGVVTWYLEGNTPGPLETDLSLREEGWISAHQVLARFVTQLQSIVRLSSAADEIGPSDKGKSAFLRFGDLNVDVTPVMYAKNVRSEYGSDRYFMPQGHNMVWWKATNPKEDQRRLTELNQKHNGLVLPAVRMMKWWNTNRNQGRLKGIHLEVMVEHAFEQWRVPNLAQAVHACLFSLRDQVRAGCSDPTGLGPALDTNLDYKDRSDSFLALCIGLHAADDAVLRLLQGDTAGAIAAWRRIFPL